MRTAHTPPHTITSACSTGLSHRAHTTQCTTHTPHALLALTAATRRSHATPPPPEPRAAAWMLRTSHLARTTPSTHTNHASNNHRATRDLRALHKKRNPSSEQLVRDLATPFTNNGVHIDTVPDAHTHAATNDTRQETSLTGCQAPHHDGAGVTGHSAGVEAMPYAELVASTSTPVSKIVYVLL